MHNEFFSEKNSSDNNTDKQFETFEDKKEPSKRKVAFFRLLFIQTFVCIVAVLMLLVFKFCAPKIYGVVKSGYKTAVTENDITLSEIKRAYEKIKDFAQTSWSEKKDKTASGAEKTESKNPGLGGEDVSFKSTYAISENTYLLTSRISAPVNGVVTSPFGERVHPITHKNGYHTGIDIANRSGTPIKSAFSGKVLKTGKDTAYGNYIIMEHSKGLKTFYGHCESIKAVEGMNIKKGEIIAYMGSTGYSTGPHLHFEIRINGLRVDPAYVLRGSEDIDFQVF